MPGPHMLGDQPIEEEYRQMMVSVSAALDEIFNPGLKAPHKTVGFVLLVFPHGDKGGRCNYISNGADRRDVVKLMREQIRRFLGEYDPRPQKRRRQRR